MNSRKSMGCVLVLTSLKLIAYPLHLQASIKITLRNSLELLITCSLFKYISLTYKNFKTKGKNNL